MNLEERIKAIDSIFGEIIKRDGAEELLHFLKESDFLTAPASTKYHSSYEGGLFDHSLNVIHKLCHLVVSNNLDIPLESIYIIGLLHDVCKINTYQVEFKNSKNEKGEWIKVPYYTFNEQDPIGVHADKSLTVIQDFIKLTPMEKYCIRFHMGAFEGEKVIPSLSNAIRKCPEILWVHLADQLATLKEDKKNEEL